MCHLYPHSTSLPRERCLRLDHKVFLMMLLKTVQKNIISSLHNMGYYWATWSHDYSALILAKSDVFMKALLMPAQPLLTEPKFTWLWTKGETVNNLLSLCQAWSRRSSSCLDPTSSAACPRWPHAIPLSAGFSETQARWTRYSPVWSSPHPTPSTKDLVLRTTMLILASLMVLVVPKVGLVISLLWSAWSTL